MVTRDPAEASGAALADAPAPVGRRAHDPVRPRRDGAIRAAERPCRPAPSRLSGAATAPPSPPGRPTRAPASPSPSTSSPPPSSCSPAGTKLHHRRARQVRRLPYCGQRLRRQPGAAASRTRRWTATPSCLRGALAPRLASSASSRCRRPGASGEPRGRFAIALTHDLDNLWRWTRRGFAAAGYRTARAARHLQGRAVLRELGDGADWLGTGTCPPSPTRSGRSRR